ncbi:MAG: metalloregulator ArsR/SmtB family transcription factor [Bacteroidota bacterium]
MHTSQINLDKATLERTAASLKAIAHPVRLAMIDLLKDGKRMNVTQIYMALGLEQAVASQHLSILKDKDILDSKRQGKHSYYFLKHACVVEVIDLILSTFEDHL